MHKFDTVINEFLGSLVKGTASAAGSFLKAAEDPSYLGQTIKNYQSQKQKKQGQIYTIENQPKVGDMAIYARNPEITAKVGTLVNTKDDSKMLAGQFQVTLMRPDKKPSKFSFVKTQKQPQWRIEEDVIIARNEAASGKAKDPVLVERDPKTNNNVRQQFKTMIVGKSTKFEAWSSYKDYLKSQK